MVGKKDTQGKLFETRLVDIISNTHPLFILANTIDWDSLNEKFKVVYSKKYGRPAKEIRLMVSLQYLKYTFNVSDETLVRMWVENPYWQYFSGQEYFQHTFPIDPSLMTKFRQRVKSKNMESLLEETIKSGLKLKVIKAKSLEDVTVDTTVQEKNITFPTDAKLYYRMLTKLVKEAKRKGIKLRQTYVRVGKRSLFMQSRYSHTRKQKMARKEIRKLKTYLGRVYRDIERKKTEFDIKTELLLMTADRLLKQKKDDKNKLYSIHAPEVECISKGKVHKKYEFGNKSGFVTTAKECFVVGALAFHGNPYDGHTLSASLEQTSRLTGREIKNVNVDLGYRGHDYDGDAQIHIVGRQRHRDYKIRKRLGRRASIEPIIGHIKNDGRMKRNFLIGKEGDKINTILAACGQNMRKLLRVIFWPFDEVFKNWLKLNFLCLKLQKV